MSLNNIELSPQLLAALYTKSLVGDAGADATPAPPTAPERKSVEKNEVKKATVAPVNTGFKSLGNNQKNVLVGVRYTDIVNLPDAQLDLLTNLLKACKLGLTDVAVINLNNYDGVDGNEILNHFKSKIVMLFGITPQEFGFPFEIPEYQVQPFAGRTVIHSPALHEIENNKIEKGKLWMALKKTFNL